MEIVIEKAARRLILLREGADSLAFPIALGAHPLGHKIREGDGRTPEGLYAICTRNEKSKYYLSLGISYPAPSDARAALARGDITADQAQAIFLAHARGERPPWDTPLGGFIMIHGGGCQGDWTQGCVALNDRDMECLFESCPLGTAVRIVP